MNIAIIGAGLIGRKRAESLPRGMRLMVVCDVDTERAAQFAKDFNCKSETDWKRVVRDPAIAAVMIATPNKYLPMVAAGAIAEGKHVLVEKPGARHAKDMQKIIDAYRKKKVVVAFGYNHRYHPAILKAKALIDSRKFGDVLFMRAKYGHGGRLGYEKEWRFDKDISGGGELLDQGSHLVDLVNYFAGELEYDAGRVDTLFWNTKLEDTAFIILRGNKTLANLSATCVEWKNLFCFEIMLKTAKIQIDGLGRSYGAERLTLYTMSAKMGPPKIQEYSFPPEDMSWERENLDFLRRIQKSDTTDKSIREAQYVLAIINKAYSRK